MLEDEALALVGAWNCQAHVVLTVCPVDADERSEIFLHAVSSRTIVGGTCRTEPSEVDRESRWCGFPECSLRATAHPPTRT